MANNKKTQSAPVAEEALNKSEAFFLKYKKLILTCVIALIVIIAGVMAYHTYVKAPRENKASTMLAKGQDMFQQMQYEQALQGDSTGYAGFLKIADEYSSTKAGNLAKLYAGLCYAHLSKWQEAVKYLESYKSADDQMIAPAVLQALANSYANLEQTDKAIDLLKKAADKADNKTLSPMFLIQAGQMLQTQNKNDEALKVYEKAKSYIDKLDQQELMMLNNALRINVESLIESAK